jgi:hypothetical protein
VTLDRHAQAYAVLSDPRAQRMERRLHPEDPAARAETDTLCLRCHVHPNVDSSLVRPEFQRADGVSCEACHGPAERWIAPHFRAGWSALAPFARLAQGQSDTRSIGGRVQVCVDCHVGAPGMEVNHDLIAAGHPRLSFEFASFHFLMHKHWDLAEDRVRPDCEARAWLLGQLIAARGAMRLLADRAAGASRDAQRPWPEFAEYDCAACHHNLRATESSRRGIGTQVPSRWYTGVLPEALKGLGAAYNASIKSALADVDTAMATNRPDRGLVAEKARRVVALLDEQLEQTHSAAVATEDLCRQLRQRGARVSARNGDETAQICLAVGALQRARGDTSSLDRAQIRALLQFPVGMDSAGLQKILDSLHEREPR